MARKCSSCGIPAPDEESKFCNRCGGAITDMPEPQPQFPICSTCGERVADPEAQFCDKCGGLVKKAAVCPTCGNPAVDENSKFCTRCGTTFVRPNTCPSCGFVNPDEKAAFCNRCGAPLKSGAAPAAPAAMAPRKRAPLPIRDEPVPDWDPWSDESSPDNTESSYTSPSPLGEPEPAYRAPQVRMPSKKYSHLPLVADEMKDYKKPSSSSDEHPDTGRKDRAPLKKSPLNFMKR